MTRSDKIQLVIAMATVGLLFIAGLAVVVNIFQHNLNIAVSSMRNEMQAIRSESKVEFQAIKSDMHSGFASLETILTVHRDESDSTRQQVQINTQNHVNHLSSHTSVKNP